VEKIGMNRTYVVSHNEENLKDANDFLRLKPELIMGLLNKAKTIPDGSLTSFNAIRGEIFNRISKTEQNFGVKISWLPFFNKIVKGIRMGELTVMSGPTGSGKTTFLSQLTLDLCKKDITVLWGSF
jgi:twinkle protein